MTYPVTWLWLLAGSLMAGVTGFDTAYVEIFVKGCIVALCIDCRWPFRGGWSLVDGCLMAAVWLWIPLPHGLRQTLAWILFGFLTAYDLGVSRSGGRSALQGWLTLLPGVLGGLGVFIITRQLCLIHGVLLPWGWLTFGSLAFALICLEQVPIKKPQATPWLSVWGRWLALILMGWVQYVEMVNV